MKNLLVKDLMVPLCDYVVVSMDATLQEALQALAKHTETTPKGKHPHRAVLAKNSKGNIVGKLGMIGFLKALEPRYGNIGDIERLSRAGVSAEFMESMMEELGFWQEDFSVLCRRAKQVKVKDVMHQIEESIQEDALVTEGLHKMIMWGALSVLVTREGKASGILRLSDLFQAVSDYIISEECQYTASYYDLDSDKES